MKRWHDELPLMLRRWRIEKELHRDLTFNILSDCHCLRGPGTMRKQRPFDCGRTECQLCHFSKIFGYPRLRSGMKRGRLNAHLEVLRWEKAASGT